MSDPNDDIRWSIITTSFNSCAQLLEHWSGTIPASVEWIVVDNNSTDESAKVAGLLGANVIKLSGNVGFSAANNLGLAKSSGKYVAFVNPDVRVDWTSLSALEKRIDHTGALVAPQLTNPDGSLQPNGRGAPSLPWKIRNRLVRQRNPNYQLFAEKGELLCVSWLTGAVVAGKAATFTRLRGWDESYFLYYEDIDLSLRAWSANIPVLVDGNIRWLHSWARATAQIRWEPWKHELQSGLKFYRREPMLLVTSKTRSRNSLAFTLSGKLYGDLSQAPSDL